MTSFNINNGLYLSISLCCIVILGSTTRWTYNRDGSLIELNVKATKKACTDDVVKQFINGGNKTPEHAF
ncbi:hypothetical protein SEN04528_15810 [Salmonella enterica subsp. enterica serovar Newport]|nr:hypothetical protein SEN04528_15810 [Salmonella enterica subsp. enterica serovar Newport]